MSRQMELFSRDEAPRTAAVRRFLAQPKADAKPLAWESMGAWARHIGRLLAVETCSTAHFRRFDQTARTLTAERIRACRDAEDLARVERLLIAHSQGGHSFLHGLNSVWSRADRGALLVELRNRIHQLQLGRVEPRPKNERFDLAQMPDAALLRLIQHHPNMALVDQMRAELVRRSRPNEQETA